MGLWDTNPAAWTDAQFVEPSDMTTEVQNRFLATMHLQKGFAFSAGQGNAAGGADTQLTSYDVVIPANLLSQDGNALIVEGYFSSDATSESKTAKLQLGGGDKVTIYSATSANQVIPFRMLAIRRSNTAGYLVGITLTGAGHGGSPTNYLVAIVLGTVDWSTDQTLKVFVAGSTADSLKLMDYHVKALKGDGVLV